MVVTIETTKDMTVTPIVTIGNNQDSLTMKTTETYHLRLTIITTRGLLVK